MKRFHFPSFGAGLALGICILVVSFGAKAALKPDNTGLPPSVGGAGEFRQGNSGRFGNGSAPSQEERMADMAAQMDMTVEALQAQLDTGKTMQQVAEEHGVELRGFARVRGSGAVRVPASGDTVSVGNSSVSQESGSAKSAE